MEDKELRFFDNSTELRISARPSRHTAMDSRVETATATGDLARTPRRRPMPIIDSERWLGPLLIGPAVLYIVLLVGLPFFMALYYSVSNTTTGGGTLGFVGLRNFHQRGRHPEVPDGPKKHLVFALLSQAVILVLSNALALALQTDFPVNGSFGFSSSSHGLRRFPSAPSLGSGSSTPPTVS